MMNSFSFTLPGKHFICPSLLNGILNLCISIKTLELTYQFLLKSLLGFGFDRIESTDQFMENSFAMLSLSSLGVVYSSTAFKSLISSNNVL